MADEKVVNPQESAAPQKIKPGTIGVVDAADLVPFEMAPAYIGLGLPPEAFKDEVGGKRN
jgi:hypothetical protein